MSPTRLVALAPFALAASLTLAACSTTQLAQSPAAPTGWAAAGSPPTYVGSDTPAAREEVQADARRDRPGLGTEWGETRWSPVRDVAFERGSESPFSVASVYYDDRQGVTAMATHDFRRGAAARIPVTVREGITLSVVGDDGQPLEALALDDRVYVVGEAGRRYSVVVQNSTGRRFEVVLSVDGLDAVDGTPAALAKRGYLVGPHDTLTVDGFRRNQREVAAFRFGSVRGSYAARTGSDRDVGVVGAAFFGERGADWDDDEIERRQSARPFSDARFAAPPPPQVAW